MYYACLAIGTLRNFKNEINLMALLAHLTLQAVARF